MEIVIFYSRSKQRALKKIETDFLEGIRKYSNKTKRVFYKECENAAKTINANKNLKKKVVAILGALLFIQSKVVYAGGLDGLDSGGLKILQVIYKIGYWILLPNAALGLLRWAVQQDPRGKKQFIASIAALAGLHAIQPVFDFIVGLFV